MKNPTLFFHWPHRHCTTQNWRAMLALLSGRSLCCGTNIVSSLRMQNDNMNWTYILDKQRQQIQACGWCSTTTSFGTAAAAAAAATTTTTTSTAATTTTTTHRINNSCNDSKNSSTQGNWYVQLTRIRMWACTNLIRTGHSCHSTLANKRKGDIFESANTRLACCPLPCKGSAGMDTLGYLHTWPSNT